MVVDATTGRGVPRATVVLNDTQQSGPSETTDEEGVFAFSGLPGGRYGLTVSKPTYASAFIPEQKLGRRPRSLEVGNGGTLDKVVVRLQRASAITGRVLDAFGDPVEGAEVQLKMLASSRSAGRGAAVVATSTTNDIGEYRLAPLSPGRYLLSAATQVAPGPGPPVAQGGSVIYPGVTSPDEAQPVIVAVGQSLTGLDLQLLPAVPARVSGVVVGLDGRAAKGAMLHIGQAMPGEEETSFMTGRRLGADGVFELMLVPGTYLLRAETWGKRAEQVATEHPLSVAEATVAVSGEPVEGLMLTLVAPRRVSGRIVFDSTGTRKLPAAGSLQVWGSRDSAGYRSGLAQVSADFAFSILVSGNGCRLGASDRSGVWALRSVTRRGRDLTFEPVIFEGGDDLTDVVITFSDRQSKLKVEVVDPKGNSPDESLVVVFPQDAAQRRAVLDSRDYHPLRHRVVRMAGPSRDGRAEVSGLLPGAYFLVAIDPDDAGGEGDLEWLESLTARATPHTVVDDESRTLRLKIEPPAAP